MIDIVHRASIRGISQMDPRYNTRVGRTGRWRSSTDIQVGHRGEGSSLTNGEDGERVSVAATTFIRNYLTHD